MWPTKKEITAFILALLPTWLWMGYSNTTKINGQLTSEFSINVLGIILALIALGMAGAGWFAKPPTHQPLHRALWVEIALLAVYQLYKSVVKV